MQKILVTGANGMLGQDLCPVLQDCGYEVVETDVNNLDITSLSMVESVLSSEKPNFIVHCAAYTNVDKAEEDLETVNKINVLGTENLAKVCGKLGITLIYISTDYVFPGDASEPYKTDDATNPINVYGKTKMLGEELVKKYCEKYYIARTSWLYGIHGRNFVETMISLAEKPELRVVDDQIGCPTWSVDLANAIVKIIRTKPYGIYHACGAGFTSWYGFAKEIFKLSELNVNLISCTTQEFPRPAKRPHYSVMDNGGLCRDWKLALKDYIKLRI